MKGITETKKLTKSHSVQLNPSLTTPYEIINVTVDSGAYNTVGPPQVGTYFKIANTEASKTGRHYRAANGTAIRNYGQRVVRGTNAVGMPVSLPIQVADVNKVLGSVREMVKAGNKVVFDEDANGNVAVTWSTKDWSEDHHP